MAFKTTSLNHSISDDGRRELTIKEFKRWLMRFDTDKDGRISKSELRQIIKATGGWFSGLKGRAGIKSADKNGNGYVDECEIENLIQFAQKELGVRIIPY
ncbi:putative EF-hand domain-containing protein [Helianthus annuus]|nr:putative EF-hand domain-containing protein [Helianthus annuus]